MFITLEGPEGSGKTSHIPHLVEFLREKGHTVFPTREPGGTSISEQIRDVLHDMKNAEMHPRTETLLYQAARAQIVEQVRTNVSALINGNDIGVPIAISDIVSTVNAIPGVRAMAITSPQYSASNDTINVGPAEKARIIDPVRDITVSQIS